MIKVRFTKKAMQPGTISPEMWVRESDVLLDSRHIDTYDKNNRFRSRTLRVWLEFLDG